MGAEGDNLGAAKPIAVACVKDGWGVVVGCEVGYRRGEVGDMDAICPSVGTGDGAVGAAGETIEGVATGAVDGGDADDRVTCVGFQIDLLA